MKRLVIANRGEIARRILRSARARGYRVAVVSTAEDEDALIRLEADDVLEVEGFLDAGAIVEAARAWKAGFLHPGYGFLSESSRFVELVESAGIVFVGPRAGAMRLLGNKESAKELARKRGVPTLSSLGSSEIGSAGSSKLETLLRAKEIDAPYLVKAAGGGGGRGMRVVETLSELPRALERASEEAAAGFSDPTVFVERFLRDPRHVEIQIFGDGQGRGVFLGERECSMQRRYQKVIEEAPSSAVDEALRNRMGAYALALVEETAYRGAGTVEFLLDSEGNVFFLEVNTRLQVEHPVTEEVYGVDLVAAQLELAEGGWPSELDTAAAAGPSRWAIEARVLAEDPRAGFLPTPGPLLRYREPVGPGVRVDSGVREGSRIHPGFDSLIAKVIATGEAREVAAARLAGALERMVVHGAVTNLPFLQAVLRHPDFRDGRIATGWIAAHLEELNRSLLPESLEKRLTTPGFREKLSFVLRGDRSEPQGSFAKRFLEIGNQAARAGSDLEQVAVEMRFEPGSGELRLSGEVELDAVATLIGASEMALTARGETLHLEDPRARIHRPAHLGRADGEVRAPMAGKVLELRVTEGDRIEEGELLAVVESMKMQLEVNAPIGGKVEKVLVSEGEVLDGPELLAVIAP
jgi:acetyl/propionyl-CoA carboxylase alpha subunit